MGTIRIPWQRVKALDVDPIKQNGSFASLDALRKEWQRYIGELSESDGVKVRQRSLRRLSVETGIIERLYEIDWGLTLTLVAEGFTKDVVERSGGKIDDKTIETLKAQRESLQMVLDFAQEGKKLTVGFIKELHAALTQTQHTYFAYDKNGNRVERELEHGAWKILPNHVERQDGSVLEYTPPEHVQSEVESLVRLFEDADSRSDIHPIIKAAWLHHSFVRVHPFVDGNGRVARALTLLVLERHRYAPLVVDRFHRDKYLTALDLANSGDLNPLVQLFVQLENNAFASELERPAETHVLGFSTDVARTLSSQLAALKLKQKSERQKALQVRAVAISAQVERWFKEKEKEIRKIFERDGITKFVVHVGGAKTGEPKANWFRSQINESARRAGHYADYSFYTAWCSFRIKLPGIEMRYVASLHGSGKDTGVMALATFGELEYEGQDENRSEYVPTTAAAFRFVNSEPLEAITSRREEFEALLDEGLAVALASLLKRT